MFRKLVWLACFILALTACENAKPSVVIVSPAHGSQFREGETVAVQSTATDTRGVARVELLVDGAVVRLDTSPTPQTTFTLIQTWQATAGAHTLMVRAYNTSGAVSDPAAVSIVVSASGASLATPPPTLPPITLGIATPLPPPTIVSGGTPILTTPAPLPTTPAPVPTTPAPMPTTPAAQTGCVGTPNIESFTASPTTISAGGSSTLSWGAVTNADAVEIDQGIGGVATPGSRAVSPATTTTYTLTARCGANIATRQVTIVVGAAFAVTDARMTVASRTYNGVCPATFDIEGEIRTNGEGTVTYRWERSMIVGGVGATTLSPTQSVSFIGSARLRTVQDADLRVTASGTYRVRLLIVTPNALSTNQVTFTVNCLASPTPSFTPTFTRTPTPLPRVTGVTVRVPPDNYSGRCPYLFKFWADITVDRAGTIKYRWLRSDGFVGPEHELAFGSAGTRTIEGEWQITKDGSYRVRLEFTQPSGVWSTWSPYHNVDCR